MPFADDAEGTLNSFPVPATHFPQCLNSFEFI